MTNHDPTDTTNLDTIYGSRPIPWSRPRELLVVGTFGPGTTFFLGTLSPGDRPHAAGIGVACHDGELYFQCGAKTRKARNIAANPACTISASLSGIDLVFEGDAARVSDTRTLEAVAALYRDGGWPVQVDGDAFTAPYSAPSAGPPPWQLYRLTAHTVFGVATREPHGATRWRF